MRVKELFAFIQERHNIYLRRQQGQSWPWTKDPILQKYRFCNIFRELDKVTVWLRKNWFEPHATDPNLWFASTVARMYNLPSTLVHIDYPIPYKPEHIRKTVKALQNMHQTIFSAAYMVRCDCQVSGKSKTDYLLDKVFTPMFKQRDSVTLLAQERSLEKIHARLCEFYGMGSFMAAQVIADAKFHGEMRKAEDWWTFSAPGPGSMRGMSWVWENGPSTTYTRTDWSCKLHALQVQIDYLTAANDIDRISAQDIQNCLCEFDKYERARTGQGRPKQLYKRS